MALSRRQFVGGAVAVAGAVGSMGATGFTPPARPGPAGLWREFEAAPTTHPQIPYVGRAGAHGGARRAPRPRVVANAVTYGATPDARRGATDVYGADSAPAINRALLEAGERGGGTVLLPPGTYRIDDYLRIGHSGVVLRGAGSGRTTLLATRHLTELIGPYGSRYGGDKSSWSWAGGLVWLSPHARHASLVAAIRDRAWPFEGWTGNRRDEWTTLTTLRPARRGDRSVTVEDPSALRRGQLVLLRLADDPGHTLLEHMAGGGPGPEAYTWDDKTKLTSYVPYEWPVRITGIAGRRVTLERPLPLDLRPEWDPRLVSGADPLTDSGVVGLTLEAPLLAQSPHLLDKGFNGVTFQCAYDCWAEDVVVRHVDNGFGLVAASACTLRRTRVEGRGSHHPYFCREGAHDNLVEDFRVAARTVPAPAGTQLHGINVEGLSSHNVWSRGVMETGTFDTHRGMPFANVRTEITVENDGRHGGDASAGPLYGARFAHWNVTVTNGRAGLVKLDAVAPYSATVGISEVREFDQINVPDFAGELHARVEAYGSPESVRPRNLYEAQRALSRR
ncbi:glycosyl hydrolase family 28-related protein [Streptomyces sp. SBC-4]|nr:glycosyl hydrolase family 28-related protein [Streptomyces sp. SBC-4]MDV5147320.1 glycosyl hydrolase family 28-related protein [Streptomyces sp. SBC-4]